MSPTLGEAIEATIVSSIGGIVVALITAPHQPALIRRVGRTIARLLYRIGSMVNPSAPESPLPPDLPCSAPAAPPTEARPSVPLFPPAPPPPERPAPPPPRPASIPQVDVSTDRPLGHSRVVEPALPAPGEPRRVRLLGEVRVEGVSLRGQSLALVAFLATHPGATADELAEACWPGDNTDRSYKRLKDLVSATRAALGPHYFPVAAGGRYTLQHVVTDLDDFDLRVSAAPCGEDRQRADALRSALSLVEGRVFKYPARNQAAFAWLELEHWVDCWEARIEAVTVQCAQAYADAGLHAEGVAILLLGFETLPLNVALTECLMSIHGDAGDLERVERIFRAHCDGLARVHACEPERSTAELRAKLLTRAPR